MEAFSDGVFAIAITLLVLEISVREGASEDLLGAFLEQWPSYLAYLVSFATIGAAWLAHSTITHYLHGVDAVFLRVNLLLLLLISFLPFPTGLVADPRSRRQCRTRRHIDSWDQSPSDRAGRIRNVAIRGPA
jgi:uncharacterized membrane protein